MTYYYSLRIFIIYFILIYSEIFIVCKISERSKILHMLITKCFMPDHLPKHGCGQNNKAGNWLK